MCKESVAPAYLSPRSRNGDFLLTSLTLAAHRDALSLPGERRDLLKVEGHCRLLLKQSAVFSKEPNNSREEIMAH